MTTNKNLHVAVIGAGAFGGWTALDLARSGARVTLFDSWGPGNSRASSGGETRVIRANYGPHAIYVGLAQRSLQLWRENQQLWNLQLYHKTGAVWMSDRQHDLYGQASVRNLSAAGVAFEILSRAEASRRFPQINFDGVTQVLQEEEAGYIAARRACEAVLSAFVAAGGEYRQTPVQPGEIAGGEMRAAITGEGNKVTADRFVFACGAWLGKLFPDVLGDRIRSTRQEIFFFGTRAGDSRFSEEQLPVWADHGERLMYGIPGSNGRGFKVADDTRGKEIDPTSGERLVSANSIEEMRRYVAFRFPALGNAPLLESRVCQYENTPDEHFVIDRHPAAQNVWLVGGGSGHGFKHGPAIGEMVSRLVRGEARPDIFFQLERFDRVPALEKKSAPMSA